MDMLLPSGIECEYGKKTPLLYTQYRLHIAYEAFNKR